MSFGQKYLAYPDLFPARRVGQPWGDHQVVIDLIGGPYRFKGLSASQKQRILANYGDLLAEPYTDAPIQFEYFRAAETDFVPLREFPWDYEIDLDPTQFSVQFGTYNFLGRLDELESPRVGVWTFETDGGEFDEVFANTFRLVVAYRLLHLGGGLIHSAGLVVDRQAYIFVGHSNAGKSTITRLGQEAGLEVMSDDLNALCLQDGRLVVERLPFAGDFRGQGTYGRYPLRRIFKLSKGPENQIHRLSQSRALALLTTCSPFVNVDPLRSDQLLANLEGLIATVGAEELIFRPDAEVWEFLLERQAA